MRILTRQWWESATGLKGRDVWIGLATGAAFVSLFVYVYFVYGPR